MYAVLQLCGVQSDYVCIPCIHTIQFVCRSQFLLLLLLLLLCECLFFRFRLIDGHSSLHGVLYFLPPYLEMTHSSVGKQTATDVNRKR